MENLLITGAAGFIGSSFLRKALAQGHRCVVIDKLTYAGHLANIEEVIDSSKAFFVHGDIQDFDLVSSLLKEYSISKVVNLAAESHVDNSIQGPAAFVQTNLVGTFQLIEALRGYWQTLDPVRAKNFRLLHVSTDEVFGELGDTGAFREDSPYQPSSPYSATKAGSDHLVRAWQKTYGLPCIVTNCSNNYGPRQFPEKLIPRMIDCALRGEPLPVYGRGLNVRDWIHVEDHSEGLYLALTNGIPGGTYCFGGNAERKNIHVVEEICRVLDRLRPRPDGQSYQTLISFVEDRKGHDWRYAIDSSIAEKQLNFMRKYPNFEVGLEQTVQWYLDNSVWMEKIKRER